jgi:hypothetical protein
MGTEGRFIKKLSFKSLSFPNFVLFCKFKSQSLTNLMLCGVATSNVFDGDRFLEGLSMNLSLELYKFD